MAIPIKNPRKAFNFRITIMGFDIPVFGAQNVTAPDSEVEQVTHGVANTEMHTAGIVKPGTLKVERIISLDPLSNAQLESEAFYLWQAYAQNPYLSSGGDPDDYKRTILVEELANDRETIVSIFRYEGCWPMRINGREYKLGESANVIETIEFSLDMVVPGILIQ